jgi:hypothetical protein
MGSESSSAQSSVAQASVAQASVAQLSAAQLPPVQPNVGVDLRATAFGNRSGPGARSFRKQPRSVVSFLVEGLVPLALIAYLLISHRASEALFPQIESASAVELSSQGTSVELDRVASHDSWTGVIRFGDGIPQPLDPQAVARFVASLEPASIDPRIPSSPPGQFGLERPALTIKLFKGPRERRAVQSEVRFGVRNDYTGKFYAQLNDQVGAVLVSPEVMEQALLLLNPVIAPEGPGPGAPLS